MNTATQQNQPSNRLIPVPEWNQYHSWPPQGGLRHLIFNEKSNGFASAFKRVGRRVLIDETEFFACVDRQNQPNEFRLKSNL
jgi:hypothetical protein